ncbi:MAG: ankyrin repeat domain-containing protein, partial [Firmicutes bacterium]|nr:ankyrin repeat domain-containing protein [Bacillota bacterium]
MHFLENNELIEQKHKNYTLRQYMILSVKSQKLDDLIALREAFKCEVDAFLDDPNNEKIRTFLDDVNKKNEEKIKIENSLKELKNKINVIEKTKTKEEIEKNFVRFLNSYFDSKNGEGDTHKTVKYFLEQDIDINMKTKNGSTLLISALSKKHKEVVRTLLKEGRGLNINIQNASGLTPLMFAMETDQEEMAMELLKSDYGDYIDVNLKEEHGYTPLMVAASQGWDKIVEELLKKKDINVNSQNSNGSTALMLAIYGRHEKTAEIILNKSINKIDLNIQNNHKNHKDTALILAVRKNNLRIVEKMVENIQKIEINKIDGNGRTALNYAEEPEMVYLLASKGGLKSEDINSGKTALIAAIRGNAFGRDKQRNAIVKNLLLLTKTEEELDVTDDLGYTPLMYAVTEENMEAVEMLLEKVEKMNINKESGKCRRTALDIAEGQNNRDIANLLKAKGAQMSEARKEKALIKEKLKEDQEDIEFKNKEKELSKKTEQKVKNETDNNGNVPLTEDKAKSIDVVTSYKLSLAILDGNEKLLKELLKKADKEVKNKKDKYGYTPLSTAIRKENLDAVKILVKDEEIEIKLQELISSISINGKDDIFNELLENAKKEIINGTDEQGQTMLMYASRTKKLSIVEKLLKYEEIKKEINKTNGDKTALDYAEDFEDAEAENAEIINLLKEHGAIRGKTKEGKKTKLTIAVENGNSNAVTELLEDQDIKVSVDDLDTAIINFKENIFKKLLEKADKEVKNKKNKYGDTPLSTAIRKENLDAVKILVKDEEIEIKLKELISSISINRKDDIFNELLENAKKEIINGTDEQGQTMLMCASRTMKLSIVEKLLKYEEIKKEINKTNGDKTALDYAEDFEDAEAKNAEIINLLKEHGAIRGKTKEGKKTKLTIAIENGNSNAVTELLEDQDIKVSVGDLKAAIINFKENIFKKLLEKSEKQVKNAKGPNGNTALGNALFFGKLDALKILSEDEDVEINFDELIMAVRSNDKNILEM